MDHNTENPSVLKGKANASTVLAVMALIIFFGFLAILTVPNIDERTFSLNVDDHLTDPLWDDVYYYRAALSLDGLKLSGERTLSLTLKYKNQINEQRLPIEAEDYGCHFQHFIYRNGTVQYSLSKRFIKSGHAGKADVEICILDILSSVQTRHSITVETRDEHEPSSPEVTQLPEHVKKSNQASFDE